MLLGFEKVSPQRLFVRHPKTTDNYLLHEDFFFSNVKEQKRENDD